LIVEEDGEPQTIAHFTQARDLPVSVGIVLDTSASMEPKISTATSAVEHFIRTIHADDDVFLMDFFDLARPAAGFHSDREKLARVSGAAACMAPPLYMTALSRGFGRSKAESTRRKRSF